MPLSASSALCLSLAVLIGVERPTTTHSFQLLSSNNNVVCHHQHATSQQRRRRGLLPTTTTTTMMAKLSQKERRARYPSAGKLSVVLLKDVPPHGKEGDVLRVARGFALNYLTPQGLAAAASPEIIAEFEAKRAALEAERQAAIEAASAVAAKLLAKPKFVVRRKAGEDGKLFGAVTPQDLVQVLSAASGTDLQGKKVTLPASGIHDLGDYPVAIALHPEVSIDLVLSVVEAE